MLGAIEINGLDPTPVHGAVGLKYVPTTAFGWFSESFDKYITRVAVAGISTIIFARLEGSCFMM